ncbi:DUF2267 domain-containing protein [Halorarum salinum]|uniref:DUF2267 domain-containing protein n=1 Tax=Halorarum salinum TaxID=2743089 RepID=A0A7D5LDT2_9EURY|nr:DUF2267 domain-containing protein [Halobaculum salinum]QLG64208.1 DUF2267 domain-containing protein [Halobaculum salinum]
MSASADEFHDRVARLADLPPEEAERITEVTLLTLGRRISRGEAEELAELLPTPLDDHLLRESDESPESFPVDAFVERVRERAGDPDDPERPIEAVLATFADAGARNELAEARSQLPPEYGALFDTADLSDAEGVDAADDLEG